MGFGLYYGLFTVLGLRFKARGPFAAEGSGFEV